MADEHKQTISRAEYHQLLGLMLLADRHNAALREIILAGESILAIPFSDFSSHVADEVWGVTPSDADGLLRRLNITVAEEPAKEMSRCRTEDVR